MSLYNIELVEGILKVGFGDEVAGNDKIVPEAIAKAEAFKASVAGSLLKINGPASLPVAVALGHIFAHVVPAIACFDPKLNGYVVCISHSPDFVPGQIV